MVGNPDEKLKNDDVVLAAVESLLVDPDPSDYFGSVGQRIEVTITVEKVMTFDGYYGTSNMHLMRDTEGHLFVWTTASKRWEEGSVKTIKGTIKEHKLYRNAKQTVLTRCVCAADKVE